MNTGRLSSAGKHDLRDLGAMLSSKGSGGSGSALIRFGIVHNTKEGHVATWVGAKIKGDRGGIVACDDFSNAAEVLETYTGITTSIADGCSPIVLISSPKLLSEVNTAAYAKVVKEIVKKVEEEHPGKCIFELFNEPMFNGPHGKSNAKDYANLIKAAYTEVESLGLAKMPILLVASFLTYEEVNAEGTGTGIFSDYTKARGWLKDIATQWPEGLTKINGLTSHPYGEPGVAASGEGNNNIRAAKLQHEQAVALGYVGASNWWITEVGFYDKTQSAAEFTGFGSVPNEATQNTKTKEALEEMQTFANEGWLKGVVWYTDHPTEGWNIWARTAQATYTAFATVHGA